MSTDININESAVVSALNNKVDLDLNNSSGILNIKNGGTGRDNGIANDIAINNDDDDLASNRGLFKAIVYDKVDFNTLTKQGLYAIAYADNPNGPGFSCRLIVIEGNLTLTQIALSVDGTKHKVRGRNSSGEWEDWIFVLTSFNVTDGVLFDSLTGKLSVDSSVVRTAGDQTIGGAKTFTNNITTRHARSNVINAYLSDIEKGSPTTETQYVSYFGYDKSNNDDSVNRLFGLEMGIGPERTVNNLYAYKNEKDSTTRATLGVCYPNEGEPYAYSTATRETPTDLEIITAGYLRTHYLSLTNNQDIYGIKTFHQDIQIKSEDNQDITPQVDLVYHDIDRSTAPDTTRFCGVTSSDKNNNPLGALIFEKQVDNIDTTCLRVYDATGRQANFRMYYPPEGNPYILAPSTRDNPDNNELVTVGYLNKKIKELQDQITILQQQINK